MECSTFKCFYDNLEMDKLIDLERERKDPFEGFEVCWEDQEFFTITYKTFPMYGCLNQIIRGLEPCIALQQFHLAL